MEPMIIMIEISLKFVPKGPTYGQYWMIYGLVSNS